MGRTIRGSERKQENFGQRHKKSSGTDITRIITNNNGTPSRVEAIVSTIIFALKPKLRNISVIDEDKISAAMLAILKEHQGELNRKGLDSLSRSQKRLLVEQLLIRMKELTRVSYSQRRAIQDLGFDSHLFSSGNSTNSARDHQETILHRKY